MSPYHIDQLLNIVYDLAEAESWIAYTVLHNGNIEDGTLDFVIQYVIDNKGDFLEHHKDAQAEKIDGIEKFLRWLKSIPAEERDAYMEWDGYYPE